MNKLEQKQKRKLRVRKNVSGTASQPRLSVCKSNKNITAQLIDDEKAVTIVGLSTVALKDVKGTKTDVAKELGKRIGKLAVEKKIKKVSFDRGSSRYQGRVKVVAEGAREAGLEF